MELIISGYNGKMGQCLRALFAGNDTVSTRSSCDLPKNFSSDCLWIDFSHPSYFDFVIGEVKKHACPLIMGTTGLSSGQMSEMKQISEKQVVVYDSNFSLGINAIKTILPHLTSLLRDFDIDIVEAHHKSKKDAPSGTAKSIQQILQRKNNVQVPITSLRAGGIRGEHSILYAGQDELVSIKHEALDRRVFAQGVAYVIQWIVRKKPSQGFFNMQDILHDCIS